MDKDSTEARAAGKTLHCPLAGGGRGRGGKKPHKVQDILHTQSSEAPAPYSTQGQGSEEGEPDCSSLRRTKGHAALSIRYLRLDMY